MSKMKELSMVLDELVNCGQGLIDAANALRKFYNSPAEEDSEPEQAAPVPQPATKHYEFIDVRKAFPAKARAGFNAEVKAIITKHGADKLSAVPESEYPVLMAELEAIK